MSGLVLDASLALQWFLEDEVDRKYSLEVLASLSRIRAVVPLLWFYEVGNGLLMAYRRKRIAHDQIEAFLSKLKGLPIEAASQSPSQLFTLPTLAEEHGLTNYDAAYLALALQLHLPLATTDSRLRNAANAAGVEIVVT